MSTHEITIILGPGISLSNWIASLQSALVRRKCLGHVFHNIQGIKPVLRPTAPEKGDLNDAEYSIKTNEYEVLLASWIEGEIEARNILVNSITKDICPQHFLNMTAKQIFDHVANSRGEGATTPWETAVRKFLSIKFTTTAENYCNEFLESFLDVNSAAEKMISPNLEESKKCSSNIFEITSGLAAFYVHPRY